MDPELREVILAVIDHVDTLTDKVVGMERDISRLVEMVERLESRLE